MKEHPENLAEVVEAYLDRTLSESEERVWEEHYLSCEACFRHLRKAQEMRRFFREERPLRARSLRAPSWLDRLRPWFGGWRPALSSAFVLFALFFAVRGMVRERTLERELGEAYRVTSRFTITLPRSTDETILVERAPEHGRSLLTFTLHEPSAGADELQLHLEGPTGRAYWRDHLARSRLTMQISVVVGHGDLVPGRHRFVVEELRSSDDVTLDRYEIPFTVESR